MLIYAARSANNETVVLMREQRVRSLRGRLKYSLGLRGGGAAVTGGVSSTRSGSAVGDPGASPGRRGVVSSGMV